MSAARRHVDDVVPHVGALVVGGEPQERRVPGTGGDHGVLVEVERALAVDRLVAAVAAVVDDLTVARPVRLDQHVAVDPGVAVARVDDQRRVVLRVDEVELAVAALDPVVAHHRPDRPVLERVAVAAGAQRTEAVVLEDDAHRRRVVVVLEGAPDVAVVVEIVLLDQDVLRVAVVDADEQAVAGIVHAAAANHEMLAALDVDRGGVGGVGDARSAGVVGEGVAGLRTLEIEILDHDVLRKDVGAGGADLQQPARFVGVVELEARGGAVTADDGQVAARVGNAADRDRLRRRAGTTDDPFLAIRGRTPVDLHRVAGRERLPRHVADVRERLPGADVVGRGTRRRCDRRHDHGRHEEAPHERHPYMGSRAHRTGQERNAVRDVAANHRRRRGQEGS